MRFILKNLSLLMLMFFISACFDPPTSTTVPDPNPLPRTEEEYIEKIDRDGDRDVVIRNARTTRRGEQTCEDLTGRAQDDCEEICKDIYSGSRKERRECEELEVSLIEDLKEVHELLEEGDADDFSSIDPELFDTYLNISISGLDEIIEDYSSSEAEDFLYWLIEDEDIGEIFQKEDDDFKSLTKVFEQLKSSFDVAEVWEVFDEDIDGDDLIEVVVDAGEEVVEWFMDYINEKNDSCEDDVETTACFLVYCKIGDMMKDPDDWLRIGQFESYIEDIIKKKVNEATRAPGSIKGPLNAGEGWTYGSESGNFKELDDLTNDWVESLCDGLK